MSKALIGDRAHARQALDGDFKRPDDWTCFYEGSLRNVYLHRPTDVVYKVDSFTEHGWMNRTELRHARNLRRIALQNVYIPKVAGFRFDTELVIAMEFIDGTRARHASRDAFKDARKELFEVCRFQDMHGDNFFFLDGKAVPVDMACPRVPLDRADRRCLSCGDDDAWGVGDDNTW